MAEASERLTDVLDIASETTEMFTRASESNVRANAKPKQVRNADGTWPVTDCDDCGEPIGEKRLEATGAVTCIDCQTLKETRGKGFAR